MTVKGIYLSGGPEFIPVSIGVSLAPSVVFYCMLCLQLFVVLSFSFCHCKIVGPPAIKDWNIVETQ